MKKSTDSLIAAQCNLIDRKVPRAAGAKRRIHDILSDQISSLNNNESLVFHDPSVEVAPVVQKETPRPTRPEVVRRQTAKLARRSSAPQQKEADSSFLQLLTGDATQEGGSVMSAQSRLRQEIAQTHVMKCLGGYKYLEGNVFDNFVVASLPRLDTNNNFKLT